MEKLILKQFVTILNSQELGLLLYVLRPSAFANDLIPIQEDAKNLQKKLAGIIV